MTQQIPFGGRWTEQKLRVLSSYLQRYLMIFDRNQQARHYEISYVDAFAGTGRIPKRERRSLFESLIPELEANEEELRKGSARRALELDPPFDHYVFIEKHPGRFRELASLCKKFPNRDIRLVNSDANEALLKWCERLNRKSERAVVFLDPFGASVEWRVIKAIAQTRAVDLWVLFPCAGINRMLPNDAMPRKSWSEKLTQVFGTNAWKKEFYSVQSYSSILDANLTVERTCKKATAVDITRFFFDRLRSIFEAVAEPGLLYNSKGPLFALLFAAGNEKGAGPGLRIADYLLKHLN